jgi:DNA-binding transcriptional LysR family regulator
MEMLPNAQAEALLRGTLDVGFTRPLHAPYARQLRSETLYADPLIAVLPSDHPLARGPLALKQLATESFVICERDVSPVLFDKITSLCEQAGFSPRITQTSNVLSSVLALVEAGEGVSLIPSTLSKLRVSDLAFCPLTAPQGAIELVMAWSPEREGAVKTAFLDFVRARKEIIRGAARNRKIGKA